jgi:hypothetical protein
VRLGILCLILGARSAAAAPPEIFHVTTAWLQPRDSVFGTIGLDHKLVPFVELTGGLGGVADVTLRLDPSPSAMVKTGFRVPNGPGLAIAFRKGAQLAELSVMASLSVGPLALHAGGDLWQTQAIAPSPRPFGAVEWRPSTFPRTSILADVTWTPRADGLAWMSGIGIRYHAFSWAWSELGVRVDESGIAGAAVFVRLSGALGMTNGRVRPLSSVREP